MNKKKEKIVPELRFPEFENDGNWAETILDDVADYENGKAHEKEISETGKYKVVNSKFISTEGEVVKYTNSANLRASVGDILMVLSDIPNGRAIAKCFYVDINDTYTVNQRICKITPTDINNKFLFYIQNRNKYFLAFDDGVKQTNLRKDTVLSFPFFKPKNPNEQLKIANCLSSLDTLITAETDKLDHLKDHKKGLLQQLFPVKGETKPQYRFPEFENDGDWEEKKLCDFENLISGDGDWILSKNISSNGEYSIVQLSSIGFGILNKKVLKTISKKTFDELNGTPLISGDLLINRMVDSKKINNCIFSLNGKYVTSVDVCWIRKNEYFNNYFLMNLLSTHSSQQKLLSLSSGAGRVRISKKNLFERFTFLLPKNQKEQQKIADCFSSVDDLIETQKIKIKAFKKHKKGLMQQLFPNVNDI